MTGFETGLLGMDAFYSVSFRCAASASGILSRLEFHLPGWTLLSFKLWLVAWEPTGLDGVAVCPANLNDAPSQGTCKGHVLRSWKKNKKQTSYIFNKERVFLKIHEKYVFSFPFIPHSDVILRQISKYKPHVCNKKGDSTIASQSTRWRNKVGSYSYVLAHGAVFFL